MSHKANISMDGILYAWLAEVGRRMGARSVPGTARAILQAVMRAAESSDAAHGMVMMIGRLQPTEEDDTDSTFISGMMEEFSDSDRLNPTQGYNIKRRN